MTNTLWFTLLPVDAAEKPLLRAQQPQPQQAAAETKERELFFGDPLCDSIQAAFDHNVDCTCEFGYFGSGIGYHCQAKQPVCVDTTFETYCATPKYAGSLAYHVTRGTINLNATVCSEDIQLTTSPLGDGTMNNVCVTPQFCVQEQESTSEATNSTSSTPAVRVCSCQATYGGEQCDSCTTCTTPEGELGISLGCGPVVSPICMPFSLPFSSGLDVPEKDSIRPFVPQLVKGQ